MASCNVRTETLDGYLRQCFMNFGPRWGNVRQIRFGRDEAVLTLDLPTAFVSDLDSFPLHPALLDMATGGAQPLLPGFESSRDFYVPFSYGRLVLCKALPPRLYSHVRLRDTKAQGVAVFDVTLADEAGTVVAEVSDFIMKRVSNLGVEPVCNGSSVAALPLTPHSLPSEEGEGFGGGNPPNGNPSSPSEGGESRVKGSAATLASEILRHGITPAEGIQAFERVLACGVAPQVIVSPVDLHYWSTQARLAGANSAAPARRALTTTSASRNGTGAGDAIERRLKEFYSQILGIPNVGLQDDFFDLGGHSLLAVRLLTRIEMEFQKVIPLAELFQTPTIAHLAAALRGSEAPKDKAFSVIVPFNEHGKGPPLYLVHSMGGEVASFRHLARLLGPEQRFCGIQVPPEMQNAEFASSIESIASYYVDALLAFQADGPFLLGGWSVGSTIALEMAQQLTAQGRTVELLIALDGAPFNTHSGTSLWNPRYYWQLVRNFPYWVADDVLLDFSVSQWVRRVRSKIVALSEALANVRHGRRESAHQVAGFMNVAGYSPGHIGFMNALYRALCAYGPQPYPGRVLVYKSRTQPLYHLLEVERAWQALASDVEVVIVPGTHISIVREPYIGKVAEDLRQRWSQVRDATQPIGSPLTRRAS
jgi:thioesterase domain-containing protein/acyl carrier protein